MTRLLLQLEGLRHPASLGANGPETYQTGLEICRWADERGFYQTLIGEHHQSIDGYLPSPLVFAAAIGGATRRIRVRTSVLLAPLYDPIRLAEEIAVADLCLAGRLDIGLGVGYVEDDFHLFGVDYRSRGTTLDELIPLLRKAWTGELFEYRGRNVRVQPRPVQNPMPINVGGGSQRGIQRALSLADGYFAPDAASWNRYREMSLARGCQDPGPYTRGANFVWVTTEPKDRVWNLLVPHIKHQIESYQRWSGSAQTVGPFQEFDFSKPGGTYQVVTPDELLELIEQLGPDAELSLSPLLGGIGASEAWRMLETLDRYVLPNIRKT